MALRGIIDDLLAAQMPVLSWWALVAVASRASATLTLLAIFLLGAWLHMQGLATIGEIVTFMNFATMLIGRLEQIVGFVNFLFQQSAKLREFFAVLDTRADRRRPPDARDAGRLDGAVAFEQRRAFPTTASATAVRDVRFAARPGETVALVGATGSGKSTTLGLLHRVFDPTEGAITIDGVDIRDLTLASLAPQHRRGLSGADAVRALDRGKSAHRQARRDATRRSTHALELAQATNSSRARATGVRPSSASAAASLSGGERQRALDRPRAAERPADHGVRRSDQRARRHDRAADSSRRWRRRRRAARLSSSRIGSRRCATPTASWCSTRARSSKAAPSTNWSKRAVVSRRWRRRSR